MHRPARRCPDALVHHARAHGRRSRGNDDRRSPRPPADRFVRSLRRRPVRVLHARTGRLGSCAGRCEPKPVAGRDPARNVRQHLSLRHLSEDRGGHHHVARLIRTEKEVEGRYEEVWIVVDEDALDQWPAGPLTTVGRSVPRVDGTDKARGNALFTADIQLPGDAARGGPQEPVRPRARHVDRPRACAEGARRPGRGRASRPRRADRRARVRRDMQSPRSPPRPSGRPRQPSSRSRCNGKCSSRCSIPTRRCGRSPSSPTSRTTSAATSNVGSPRPTWSSRRSTGRRSWCTTRWRRTRPSVTGRTAGSRSTSRRSTSGASAARWRTTSASRPTRCASYAMRWAEASGRRTAPATTRRSRPSSRRERRGRSSAR